MIYHKKKLPSFDSKLMSFRTKVSSITLNFRSFCIERSPVKHTVRAAHNGAADRFENSPRFQRGFSSRKNGETFIYGGRIRQLRVE